MMALEHSPSHVEFLRAMSMTPKENIACLRSIMTISQFLCSGGCYMWTSEDMESMKTQLRPYTRALCLQYKIRDRGAKSMVTDLKKILRAAGLPMRTTRISNVQKRVTRCTYYTVNEWNRRTT